MTFGLLRQISLSSFCLFSPIGPRNLSVVLAPDYVRKQLLIGPGLEKSEGYLEEGTSEPTQLASLHVRKKIKGFPWFFLLVHSDSKAELNIGNVFLLAGSINLHS